MSCRRIGLWRRPCDGCQRAWSNCARHGRRRDTMKKTEAIALLTKVKANWYRQPVDELTIAEWCECLAQTEFEDAIAAVIQLRETREEPPSPGMVINAAREIARRRFEERRYRQRK